MNSAVTLRHSLKNLWAMTSSPTDSMDGIYSAMDSATPVRFSVRRSHSSAFGDDDGDGNMGQDFTCQSSPSPVASVVPTSNANAVVKVYAGRKKLRTEQQTELEVFMNVRHFSIALSHH